VASARQPAGDMPTCPHLVTIQGTLDKLADLLNTLAWSVFGPKTLSNAKACFWGACPVRLPGTVTQITAQQLSCMNRQPG